jgi:hypothetical protein
MRPRSSYCSSTHLPGAIIEPLLASVENFAKKNADEDPHGPVNCYVINSIRDFITGWETELFSDPREFGQSEMPSGRPPAVQRAQIPADLPIKCVTALLLSASNERRSMPGSQTRSILSFGGLALG